MLLREHNKQNRMFIAVAIKDQAYVLRSFAHHRPLVLHQYVLFYYPGYVLGLAV